MKQRIQQCLAGLRRSLIADACALIEIKSLHGDAKESEAALDFVLGRAGQFGMRTGKTAFGDAGFAEIGRGGELVGILAHVDVVDPGNMAKWSAPPFKALVRGGRLYGRGAEDDKGPLVAALYALRALQLTGLPLEKRLRLIVGSREEGKWTDIAHYRQEFETPAYGFSPDAAFPICNVENGYCDVVLRFAEDGWEAAEELAAGHSPNAIPSLAVLRLRGGRAAAWQGVAAHSALPEQADNAIIKMCKSAPELRAFRFARFISRFFGGPGSPPAALGIDDGGEEYRGENVGKSTAAPTVLWREAGGAALNVNIRPKYGGTRQDIERAFARYAEEYHYTFEIRDWMEPMYTSPSLPPFRLMDEVQREYGLAGGFKATRGTTYAKGMPNFVSWGAAMPGRGSAAHREDENASLGDLMLAARMYAHWLGMLAGSRTGL